MLARFIANIPQDKKSHLILGVIINFPLALIGFLLFGLLGANIGLLLAIGFHAFIEVWQLVTGKGKFEVLDFLCGSFTAVQILILINL